MTNGHFGCIISQILFVSNNKIDFDMNIVITPLEGQKLQANFGKH
jgi:hypothetical protein